MAKSALIAKLEALPRARHGKSFLERLNAKQQKDFLEALKWFHSQQTPPTRESFAAALTPILGINVTVHTITRYVKDRDYANKIKTR